MVNDILLRSLYHNLGRRRAGRFARTHRGLRLRTNAIVPVRSSRGASGMVQIHRHRLFLCFYMVRIWYKVCFVKFVVCSFVMFVHDDWVSTKEIGALCSM